MNVPCYLIIAGLLLPLVAANSARPLPMPIGTSALYRCADGRGVEVLYSGTGDVVLTIGDKIVALRGTPSAGAARYIGDGWQWTATGITRGTLAPLLGWGTAVSQAGVECTVR